jgi:indolepyruvate ferredoxin oxidoreductase, beta subunit
MDRNIILAGVGGQGILTIAYVLDNAAQELGLHFKQAEVHGMAQRGGAVQSHLRFSSSPVHSDLIPLGAADLVLSVEPLESLRYVHYLGPRGAVVSNDEPHVNIPDYPAVDELLARYEAFPAAVLVNARALARRAGSPRAENIAMIGAAAPDLGIPREVLERVIDRLFEKKGEKVVAANRKAFEYGLVTGEAVRDGRRAGLTLCAARVLAAALDPEGLSRAALEPWLPLLRAASAEPLLAALAARTTPIPIERSLELATAVADQGPAALDW